MEGGRFGRPRAIFIACVVTFLVSSDRSVDANLQTPTGMKQEDYCKNCELAVKGIIKFNADKKSDWVESSPCLEKYFKSYNHDSKSLKLITRTCNHLLDLYGDELEVVSPGMNEEQLAAWLCHEKSYSCLGLANHKKHDGSAVKFEEDEAIKKLIRENKHRIKTPYPYHYKEEL